MTQSWFLNRQPEYLYPDPTRVVVRPFNPAVEPRDLNPTDKSRAHHIIDRVLQLSPKEANEKLREVLEDFERRHKRLSDVFEARARKSKRYYTRPTR